MENEEKEEEEEKGRRFRIKTLISDHTSDIEYF